MVHALLVGVEFPVVVLLLVLVVLVVLLVVVLVMSPTHYAAVGVGCQV